MKASLAVHLLNIINNSPRYAVLADIHRVRPHSQPQRWVLCSGCRQSSSWDGNAGEYWRLAKLVVSEHLYAVQSLLEKGVPRKWRVSRFCQRSQSVEDEVHVLFRCDAPTLRAQRLRMLVLLSTRAARAESLFMAMRRRPWGYVDFLSERPKLLGIFADFVRQTYASAMYAETPSVTISNDDELRDLVPSC